MNEQTGTFSANLVRLPEGAQILTGSGGLTKLVVSGADSCAEVYLQGAQVTHFQKSGGSPVLFLSRQSKFIPGQPIRGGIPIVFPWFGAREGFAMHGFARNHDWTLSRVTRTGEQFLIELEFSRPPQISDCPDFQARLSITVADRLELELSVQNLSDGIFEFEDCFHTYFTVGSIQRTSVYGLGGTEFLDKTDSFKRKLQHEDPLRIDREVDRAYLNTRAPVVIEDGAGNRRITIEKSGSESTVVWNPWEQRARQMADFGDVEYLGMVCVESGNVAANKVRLPPGETSRLSIRIHSETSA